MPEDYPPLNLRVWGEFACFTRPEMKVERVSYPVMTPSAARGVLEAVFWKPEFAWEVREIWVLKPIRYFSLVRNEVNSRASDRAARSWIDAGGGYDSGRDRAQRHTLALRDVDYLIRADIRIGGGVPEHPAKFRDQFRRRASSGRCFSSPYLGCREFTGYFAEPNGGECPIDLTEELGPMLLDLDYALDRSGRGTPRFFNARLDAGVLKVPSAKEG